jgi:O-antigen ligase
MSLLAGAARIAAGAFLAWFVGHALTAPELPRVVLLASAAVMGLTFWRPTLGLILLTGLAPAGALFAPPPARAAELLAWSFLLAWLLRIPAPLSRNRWPRAVTLPALLYLAVVIASWLAFTIGGAAGIQPASWPRFLFQSIAADHLLRSSAEPETWTLLQNATGIALFLATVAVIGSERRAAPHLARGIVLSTSMLALASMAEVVRQWGRAGYGAWFMLRYVNGERYSLHLADLNAAASLYVLAGLIGAALATFDRRERRLWLPLSALTLPALWLSGSRSAALAGAAVGALAIPDRIRQRRWRFTRPQMAAAAAIVVIAAVATVVAARSSPDADSAGRSLRLRFDFYETTARMFASAPVFGVGVGQYFGRSNQFMPETLKRIYGNENAHNYFAQQFAELGLVGGILFVWLIVPAMVRAWRHVRREPPGDGALVGLFAGAAAYLVTCLTGHPLLVPEAALPFWAAFGALCSTTAPETRPRAWQRAAAAVAGLLVAVSLGQAVIAYSRVTATPPDKGFHGLEAAEDGTRFRWMTRHAVTYVPPTPGFITLRLHAPDERLPRPLVVDVLIDGRVVERRDIRPEQWTTIDVGVRDTVRTPFRRIDLRANQEWTQEVALGRRTARRPISAMVGEIVWTPAGG